MQIPAGMLVIAVLFLAATPTPVEAEEERARRFIPVELWAGAPWDGKARLRLPRVDFSFGRNGHKRIRGPVEYTRPRTGEVLQVYERTNRDKVQRFALRKDGQGLGRVFDSRYDRNCFDAIKFPLGWWSQGETRRYSFRCGTRTRTVVLSILDLDFTLDGVAHALRYRWVADGGTRSGTDNVYTYSPGRGMVGVRMN